MLAVARSKHILIAATAALLALPNLSSTVLAASPEASEDAGAHHPKFSAEDFAAFTDARIAALKAGLRLTPAQEKNWPALETALREQAKARGARIAEWHEKAKEPRELEKLADAAKPLYESLDDAQKGRFRPLLHIAGGRHWHHGHEGFRHS
jgi:LTXXQ motif family protein